MGDARKFNIYDRSGRLLCPACGFPAYAQVEGYDERGGLIGTTICACCFWEPGFDDDPGASEQAKGSVLTSLRAYRVNWRDGPVWQGRDELRPLNWNGAAQLALLFEIAPHVR